MGYWWSSSPSAPSQGSSTTLDETNTPSSTFSAPTQPPSTQSQTLSPSQQADREVESFLASLERNETNTPTYTRTTTTPHDDGIAAPQETPTHYAPSGTTDATAPSHIDLANLDISPRALYPRTMSCRQAFDQAFYCQSLGGKFNDLYRHGSIKSCSEHWSQFWFCMRVRTLGDNEREAQTAAWYEAREERIKKERGGSSEDVWEMRTEPVKKAFWKDPDEVTQV